jgi:hypothetical protein
MKQACVLSLAIAVLTTLAPMPTQAEVPQGDLLANPYWHGPRGHLLGQRDVKVVLPCRIVTVRERTPSGMRRVTKQKCE